MREAHLGIEVPTMPPTAGPELIPHRSCNVRPFDVWKPEMRFRTSRPNLATLDTASSSGHFVGAPHTTTAIGLPCHHGKVHVCGLQHADMHIFHSECLEWSSCFKLGCARDHHGKAMECIIIVSHCNCHRSSRPCTRCASGLLHQTECRPR